MSKPTGSESPPFVIGAAGALLGLTTVKVAWTLAYEIRNWHHGLIMIAIGFLMLGYGFGAWAAQQAREERDAAIEQARMSDAQREALEATVARSLREGQEH